MNADNEGRLYQEVGVVTDGQPIWVEGINPWEHDWIASEEHAVRLQHPQHRHQLHVLNHHEIPTQGRTISFVAGELSPRVWGFYLVKRNDF